VISSPFTTTTTVPSSDEIDDDVDYLLDLDAAEFAELVCRNVGLGGLDRTWQALLHPDLVMDTKTVIAERITEVNSRIAGRLPWAEDRTANGDFDRWRDSARREITDLTRRQNQVKNAAREVDLAERMSHMPKAAQRYATETVSLRKRLTDRCAEVDQLNVLVRALAQAVNGHRLASIGAGLDPEPHDVALWDVLDELRLPSRRGEPPSLADLLTSANPRWNPAAADLGGVA
jgi:hypothetical protein